MRLPNEVDEIYSEKELLERILKIPIWARKIPLGSHVVTPGIIPSDKKNSDKNNPQLKRIRVIMYLWK